MMKVKLSERKVDLVVNQLNEILDNNEIFGKEFTIQILIKFIQQNLYRKHTLELIKRLEESPISDWNE